eukprot:CAMPEP_0194067640 /NCGR_PEP_ID=MMETSP0009_2-20130614/86665_1 /TAXON_ID=210454 /ORGANISM="Grammatophora oceanica, Strain CCMP 410" /LENGTH=82 /DNA_ID=CAMNT_0038720673 /DNA_START=748 /DNA_END=996 /DNA_ORIENTATION=-
MGGHFGSTIKVSLFFRNRRVEVEPTTTTTSSREVWKEESMDALGDTVGCGVEVLSMRRLFFIHRGKLLAPCSTIVHCPAVWH